MQSFEMTCCYLEMKVNSIYNIFLLKNLEKKKRKKEKIEGRWRQSFVSRSRESLLLETVIDILKKIKYMLSLYVFLNHLD